MRAEILTIGTELLLGEIVDTNAAYIAKHLADIGIDHYYTVTVGDNEDRISAALCDALARADVVIATGGLGPTVDDVTRQAVARAVNRPLVLHPELLTQIEARFRSLGVTMTENNRRQAYIPQGAIVIENPVGTAPAFIVEQDEKSIVVLPGVPHEMRYLLETHVLPHLQAKMGESMVILTRVLHTAGLGESQVDMLIQDLEEGTNPTVGLSAHPGQTDIRITAKAPDRAAAQALIAPIEAQVRERLGVAIYGADGERLEDVIIRLLQKQRQTLVVVESVSGGMVASRLSCVAGAKGFFLGGLVMPDLASALRQLGIPNSSEGECGVAAHLVARAREAYKADWALAVLENGDEGSVCLALATVVETSHRLLRRRDEPEITKLWLANVALDFLRRRLLKDHL
ncbi:MAG: CinA family nicotinamide mononucleotide deamidase-related protein [Chloroflexi bacterium]|nr:CinA family nicotinamide mononucleotide deamidase-related protein [Chloroflexota bacterium]